MQILQAAHAAAGLDARLALQHKVAAQTALLGLGRLLGRRICRHGDHSCEIDATSSARAVAPTALPLSPAEPAVLRFSLSQQRALWRP